MNDKAKEAPGAGARKPRAARRPATIDLSATEVKEEAAGAPAQDAAAAGKPGRAPADAKAAPAAPKPAPDKSAHDRPAQDRPAASAAPGAAKHAGRAAAPQRPGALVFAAGALAGGVVALALYGGLAQTGLMPAGADTARLENRIRDLEIHLGDVRNELSGQSSRGAQLPEGLARGEDVAALQARLGALEARGGETGGVDVSALEDKVLALSAQVAAAEQAAAAARGDVEGLTARLAAASGDPASAAAEALGQRLKAAEEAAARAGEAASAAARGGEAAIAALRAQVERDIESKDKALSQRLDTLASDLAALRQEASSDAARAPALQARAALAIAVAGLERAVLAGVPFGRELHVVATLSGPGNAQVAALEPLAAKGVARPDQLAEAFPQVASAILDAGARTRQGGLVGRVLASARALVRVRPTGAVSGDSVAAVVARIEARLDAGDLAGALAEAEALDEAAQGAAGDWLKAARAALAARGQVQVLAEQAAAGLAAGNGVRGQ